MENETPHQKKWRLIRARQEARRAEYQKTGRKTKAVRRREVQRDPGDSLADYPAADNLGESPDY